MSVDSARKLAARSLRRLPQATLVARRLDRKLTPRVDRLRHELRQQRAPLRKVTKAIAGDAVAEARLAAVLDGRTLNIDMHVPGVPFDDVLSAELRAVRGHTRRVAPARVRSGPGGALWVEATALLDDNPGGFALRPGTQWLLEVALSTRSGGQQVLRVLGGRQDAGTRGLTVPSPPHPETGRRYRVRVRLSGRLAITVAAPAPVAEVSRLDLDWLTASLEVRLVGRPPATPATIEIVKRGGAAQVSVPTERTAPDRVRCDLPLAKIAQLGGGARLFLRTGGRRLRVGRELHDLANAGKVIRPTPAIVWTGPGKVVRVEATFSPAGALTLACRPL
ncbi:hypothetical protein ACQP2F_42655 [Actinoplanes sp. CA-030573]|uniref:hypothetical protein n=1 Tax=Actinoplanes sp. CA-030573 TaxID=3239898 RepID=UPI003D93BCA8